MTTVDAVKLAHLAIHRKPIGDLEATATAGDIDKGSSSLDKMIVNCIRESVATTAPAIAVLAYVDGIVPTSAKITELATTFEVNQYAYYRDVLGVAPAALAIAPYEATGRAVAQSDPAFAAQFASGTDQDFITTNYVRIFGEAPTEASFANLQSQLTYFTDLYLANGIVETAGLEARGAVLGQMIGYAFTDPAFVTKSTLSTQITAFLTHAATGSTIGYGAPLPAPAEVNFSAF